MPSLQLILAIALTCGDNPAQRLTFDGRLKRDPVFIAEGKEILYAGQHSSPQLVLLRLRVQDGSIERLHPKEALPEFRPQPNLQETAISFLQMTGNDSLTMKVEFRDKPEAVAIPASKKVVWHGSIAPDGARVVYSAAGQIFSYELDKRKEQQLTSTVGRNNWPAISPDGQRIAFGSGRSGNYEVFSMRLDGSDVKQLTSSPGIDMRPSWSADGKWIAFTSNRDGNHEVYRMRTDGTRVTRLTHHQERDDYAAWHPDGKRLVVVSERNGQFDLYLIDAF